MTCCGPSASGLSAPPRGPLPPCPFLCEKQALREAEQRAAELAKKNAELAAEAERAAKAEAARRELAQTNDMLTSEAATLQAKLAMINRGFDNLAQAGPSGASEPDAISDSLSDFNFSDSASLLSEAASRRGGPVDEARLAANRQRIAQNKAKFEAIKAERNNFKAEARKAAKELERMRSEVSKVEELKAQLRQLQEARAGGRVCSRGGECRAMGVGVAFGCSRARF